MEEALKVIQGYS